MEKHKVSITADTVEKFTEAQELLNKLPENVLSQIVRAEFNLAGLKCEIKDKFEDIQEIILPNKVTHTVHSGDYLSICCGTYFFVIKGKLYEKKYSFTFIECKNL